MGCSSIPLRNTPKESMWILTASQGIEIIWESSLLPLGNQLENQPHRQRMNMDPYHYLTRTQAWTSALELQSYPERFKRESHHYN